MGRDSFTVKSAYFCKSRDALLNRVTYKLFNDVMLDILHTFRFRRAKGLAVTLPADENFPNAKSHSLV